MFFFCTRKLNYQLGVIIVCVFSIAYVNIIVLMCILNYFLKIDLITR